MKTTQEASSSFNSVFASVSNLFFANENKNNTKLHDLAKGDLVIASHADSDSSAKERLEKLLNTDLKNKINLQDEKGNTPLHYAVMYGNNLCAELLLENGAHLDITNNDGNIPANVTKLQDQNMDFENTIEDKFKKTKEVIEKHQETTKENIYTLSNDENHDSDGYAPMEPKSNDGSHRVCSFLPTW